MMCPKCKSESVTWNPETKRHKCGNCGIDFSYKEGVLQKLDVNICDFLRYTH
jgi:transposase-like protein